MFTVKQHKRKSQILPYAFTVGPATVYVDTGDVMPTIISWIVENIGPYDKKRWQMRHGSERKNLLSVYFASEQDALMFKMRWM